jgi:hypothetical protein
VLCTIGVLNVLLRGASHILLGALRPGLSVPCGPANAPRTAGYMFRYTGTMNEVLIYVAHSVSFFSQTEMTSNVFLFLIL